MASTERKRQAIDLQVHEDLKDAQRAGKRLSEEEARKRVIREMEDLDRRNGGK